MHDDDAAAALPPRGRVPAHVGPGRASPRRTLHGSDAQVLGVVAVGGMLGAAARHGAGTALTVDAGDVPWSTVVVNVSGCLLIGVLMVLAVEARQAHRLLRPFLGVGVLGGYTTFSTYAVDAQVLVVAGRPALALGYLLGTAVAALLAVQFGVLLTRALALPRSRIRTTLRARQRGGSR